jgi:peptidoglycan/LPS O-acetylase OafA/YrhL
MSAGVRLSCLFGHYVIWQEGIMWRERALKVVLVLVGLLFSAGVYPVMDSLWHANQSMYTDDMMLSLYVALGIFLLIAVRNPLANRSLIAFAAWSSFAHAAVMAVMAFQKADEREDLWGVAALVIIGVALIVLAPATQSGERPSAAGA